MISSKRRMIDSVFLLALAATLSALGCNEPERKTNVLVKSPAATAQKESAPVLKEAAAPAAPAGPSAFQQAGERFVKQVSAGQFEDAVGVFDKTLQENLGAGKLKTMWEAIGKDHGAFLKPGASRQQTNPDQVLVIVPAHFERGIVEFHLIFDKASERVVGIKAVALDDPAPASQPAGHNAAILTRELSAGEKGWPLPGTLTLPKAAKGKVAAIVFVHDSGPFDRDETVGPNKLFAELARGLALRGIASYRYDSRRKVHAERIPKMKAFTAKEEFLNDALAAVAQLRTQPEINPAAIFVAGHGLGGTVAPRLLLRDPQIAGLILLGAPSTPLEDNLLRQVRFLMKLDEKMTAEEKKRLTELEKQVAAVKTLKEGGEPGAALPFDIPASYWLDLRQWPPLDVVKKTKAPILVLQGARDAQVERADFQGWARALRGRKGAMTKSYPALDHLFHEGERLSTPVELMKPGKVPIYVFDDVAAWVKGVMRR